MAGERDEAFGASPDGDLHKKAQNNYRRCVSGETDPCDMKRR